MKVKGEKAKMQYFYVRLVFTDYTGNCASDFFSYFKCTIGLYYYVLVEVQAILAY